MSALMVISNVHEIPRAARGETHGIKGTIGEDEDMDHWKIGFYPPSLAYPYKLLKKLGMNFHFCSPNGEEGKVDPWGAELWDHPVVRTCLDNPDVAEKLKNTERTGDLKGSDYDLVHFVGSHGSFFDVVTDEGVKRVVRECYEAGGYVSANTDGLNGLLNVKLSNGEPLVKGKKCTGVTKVEQGRFDQAADIPYFIEDKLKEEGAEFKGGIPVRDHVIKDQRLVTGQNPNSAEPLSRALGTIMKARMKEKKLKEEAEKQEA